MPETRILNFDGEVVKGEKVTPFTISKIEVENKRAELAAKKLDIENKVNVLKDEYADIEAEEAALEESIAIIAQAEAEAAAAQASVVNTPDVDESVEG